MGTRGQDCRMIAKEVEEGGRWKKEGKVTGTWMEIIGEGTEMQE